MREKHGNKDRELEILNGICREGMAVTKGSLKYLNKASRKRMVI